MSAAAVHQQHDPIWAALAEGARRTGHLRASDHDGARCVAANALAVLNIAGFIVVPDEPNHVLDLRDDGWTLQHSLSCRLSSALFDCPVNTTVREYTSWNRFDEDPGRYVVSVDDDGDLVVGERVAS